MIKKTLLDILKYKDSKIAKQSYTLFSTEIIILILGFFITAFNTRILGPQEYGIFAFLMAATNFILIFFHFGLFQSTSYLLAHSLDTKEEKKLIGAITLITLVIGIFYALFCYLAAFFIDNIFSTNVGFIIQKISPLLTLMPFQMLILELSRGTNKIQHLAWFKIFPKILYVLGLIFFLTLYSNVINAYALLVIYLLTLSFSIIIVMLKFEASFSNMQPHIKQIFKKNKEYGIHVYWGQIANRSTFKLDDMFITYFVNTTSLGFYTLAVKLTSPLTMLSNALSISLFKEYAKRERIPKSVLIFNFLFLLSTLLILVFSASWLVELLFTNKFIDVVPLILPLGIAAFFDGLSKPYSFIAAKGRGKWIRNVAIAESTLNVLGNLILIYVWGVIGAAIASAISKFVRYIALNFYYNRFVARSINDNAKGQDV